jgi:hypothetical protein
MTIPFLPVELWISIFSYAVHVPGAFDTSSLLPATYAPRAWNTTGHISSDIQRSEFSRSDSMTTKCQLVRVCKLWNSLATELLYEDIQIRYSSSTAAAKAVLALQKPLPFTSHPRAGSSCVGHLTKRLLIHAKHHTDRSAPRSHADLTTLLSLCRNLVVLEVDVFVRPDALSAVIASHAANFSSTLRYVRWDSFYPSQSHLFQGTSHHFATLNALNLRIMQFDWEHLASLHASFPYLHTLEVSGPGTTIFLHTPPQWELPSLTTMIVHEGLHPTFFTRYGHTITSLDISRAQQLGWEHVMAQIIAVCPSLRFIHSYATLSHGSPVSYRQPLKHVYFRTGLGDLEAYDDGRVRALENSMDSLEYLKTPPLECVRLTDFYFNRERLWWAPIIDLWNSWIEKLAARGVRFEDQYGHILEVPADIRFAEGSVGNGSEGPNAGLHVD